MSSELSPADPDFAATMQDRAMRKRAGVAFVLTTVVVVAGFGLALRTPGYENPVFLGLHVLLFLGTVFTAIGVTALVYGVGVDRLGLPGLIGSACSWLAVGAAMFWLMLAYLRVRAVASDAIAGTADLGVVIPVLEVLRPGIFPVIGVFVMIGLGATAVALVTTTVLNRLVAGVGVLTGVVGVALFALLASGITITIMNVFILPVILAWLWTLPLGIALYLSGRAPKPEDETQGTEST